MMKAITITELKRYLTAKSEPQLVNEIVGLFKQFSDV